ncbi:protein-disulfide reductase DsbD family protein [Pedobacter nyackensis]|uniref:protein-disulfide reductase DsbD family protein n=1 Tax=Pedobacter nyackensis TaxID=475255 RepID=UPI002930B0C1|nr:cytochrome c biogenesis protein CcdA [Pedobacter nyackensis]
MKLNHHMFMRIRLLILGLFIFLGTATSVLAQDADTTISDLEFTEMGAETAPVDTVAAAPTSTEVKATKDSTATAVTAVTEEKAEDQSLIGIFITGFIGGLAALLMPCIFPMLPLTVSFFTKGSQSKGTAVSRAMFYGLSIIVIYVVLGLLVTVIFGADALNSLSTNGVFNFLFFVLLMIFAISFLGAFEITLPSSWVNKMDANSDKGGLAGLFFMAGTLALVSFSCTGPIIGTLLVQAATSGALLGPAIGMFGFSFALAIPFALFAMFPSWLSALPKSGGWLNSVKVVLGFLELALAMKFLSNVDLAYHWNWFDREIFLVLWIVIFGLMGLYLLGKLKFSHDSPVNFISIPRLMISIVVLSFTVYMIPGLWGAPLKSISAFLPPQGTQDFDLYTPTLTGGNGGTAAASNHSEGKHKYADIFHAPLNLNVFFDYDEGMAYAKKVGKPVMVDFTGHACVNCREMEANVWSDKAVYSKLNNDYVIISLYVDDKTELEESEKYKSTFSGKDVKTIGNKWSDVQASKFNSNSQPYYVLLGHDEQPLVKPSGANRNITEYLQFLESGLTAFKKK